MRCSLSVFDNVLAPQTCQTLTRTLDSDQTYTSHALFRKNCPKNYVEKTLAAILSELEKDSTHETMQAQFVEYWMRRHWKHIEAHADVDEELAQATGEMRYPRHAHVLYLQVGSDVRGPTCVFSEERGADLCRATLAEMAIIPAVDGRLLRFNGNLLHAVPNPSDVWFVPFSSPPRRRSRSVILFNTWVDPPDISPNTSILKIDQSNSTCNARHEWRNVKLQNYDKPPSAKAKIWLLGDEIRRGQLERTVAIDISEDVVDSLNSVEAPSIWKIGAKR